MRMTLILLNCLLFKARAFSVRGIMSSRAITFPRQKFCPSSSAFRYVTTNREGLSGSDSSEIESEIKQWNLKGIRNEIVRRQSRIFKKVQKANERLGQAQAKSPIVASEDDSDVSCTSSKDIEDTILELQSQMMSLNILDEDLKNIKSTNDNKFAELIPTLIALDIKDTPTPRKERTIKVKGPKPQPAGPRMPYYRYESVEGIEIRVGKGADDNDELSCNPAYRDGNQWWMHVAGYPGSHVVICSSEEDIRHTHKQTVIDAALLTAMHSKAGQAGKVQVTLTRCRNVSKPRGAKPGLVQLVGDMYKIDVNVRGESKRMEYLKRL